MPKFTFHVTGNEVGVSSACDDSAAARVEAVAICGDLARDAFRKLTPEGDWRMTVTNEAGKTVFAFRICEADLPGPSAQSGHQVHN